MHEITDAETNGEVVGVSQDVQNEVKRLRMCQGDSSKGERPSVLVCGWSITRAVENDQHTSTIVDNIPEGPPDPPAPPDKPTNPSNKSLSIELKEEREELASTKDVCTSDKADMLEASIYDDNARRQPKKLQNASVHECKCSAG